MPLLSILTPVLPSAAQWLEDAAVSIRALQLPPHWEVEWIVQEDGSQPTLTDVVEELGGLYGINPRQGGAGFTRNMGLMRVNGEATMLLDADDVLIPEGVRTCLEQLPALGWVSGMHIRPDGSPRWTVPQPRAVPIGGLHLDPHGIGFHPNNLIVHTSALWAAGGWPALMGVEDLLFLMQINRLCPGVVTDTPTIIYRDHSGQTIKSPTFRDHLDTYKEFVSRVVAAQGLNSSEPPMLLRRATDATPLDPGSTDRSTTGAEEVA